MTIEEPHPRFAAFKNIDERIRGIKGSANSVVMDFNGSWRFEVLPSWRMQIFKARVFDNPICIWGQESRKHAHRSGLEGLRDRPLPQPQAPGCPIVEL